MTVISTSDATDWAVFEHQTQDGRPVIVRTRLGNAELRAFAAANFVARARCAFMPDKLDESGMPLSTAKLDEWEDKLVAGLGPDATTYQLAVVTGAGARDFIFAAAEGEELLRAISEITGDFPFDLQLARVEGPKEGLLNSLTPPALH